MRRYYHYKKRSRPFPIEILSAMRGDPLPPQSEAVNNALDWSLLANHTILPTVPTTKSLIKQAKAIRTSFQTVGSGLIKVAQGLRESFTINKRKSGI